MRDCRFTTLPRWRFGLVLAFAVGTWSRVAQAAGLEVDSLLPAGGQRGTTVEVAIGGKFPSWPAQIWVDRPGLTFSPAVDKGKLSVIIPPETTPGRYWVRLYDAAGSAEPQAYIVGSLREIQEQEPNDGPTQAQAAGSGPVVANGRLSKAGDVDLWAVSLSKGQTLVASLGAFELLGAPVDAVMQLLSARGDVLAYNHDHGGLDPQIEFTAPADGTYLVRVFGFPSKPNQTIGFAGGNHIVYRLTLTTGGFIDHPWPLAVTRDRETRVELVGWNISESLRAVAVRGTGERADLFDAQLANVAVVAVEPHATLVEAEHNDLDKPQSIELPATINGRIDPPRDTDTYHFDAKAGQAIVFDLASRSLGYPLDAVLEVRDAAGKSLARIDDVSNSRDAQLTFSPTSDGAYRITVSDLNQQGSPRHVYRLRATAAQPDYTLAADAHAYTLVPGKPTEISLAVARQHGFTDDIAINITGLPVGVTTAAAISAGKGDTASAVKLSLGVAADAAAFSGPIRIAGTSAGEAKLNRTATVLIPGQTERMADLWLTVTAPENPAAKSP